MGKFWLFGCGKYADLVIDSIGLENCSGFIDNSEERIGQEKHSLPIVSLCDYKGRNIGDCWIIIAVNPYSEMEIAEQLIDEDMYRFIFIDEIESVNHLSVSEIYANHSSRILEYYRSENNKKIEQIAFFKDHIVPSNIMVETGYKRKRQLDQIHCVNDFFIELEKENIFPFLTCGNLLGKYRHNGFIPWDDDLDFGLMREDYEKLKDYCARKYKIFVMDELLSNQDVVQQLDWIDEKLQSYNMPFLLVYPFQIQMNFGSSMLDRISVDFWCFDQYLNVPFSEHEPKINIVKQTVGSACFKTQFEVIKKLQESEMSYRSTEGKNIYFSLDSGLSVLRTNSQWIPYDVIFPLRKIEYEDRYFYAPNKIKKYISYEYRDYKCLPDDCGVPKHYYQDEYMQKKYVTVEFYLVDAFEIFHFEPLYHIMRKHGVYARFVAENASINTSNKWFDYGNAKRILNERQLEYSEVCNIDADIAFTTQFPRILRKYRNAIKVELTYGCTLCRNDFWYKPAVLSGFCYQFVGGEFMRKNSLAVGVLSKEQIINVGTPKYYQMYKNNSVLNLVEKLNIKTEKKILCYFPTWDNESSIKRFSSYINELRNDFYVITKPHHCTYRLPEKKEELKLLYQCSDVVVDGNYNFEDIANIGDVRLCDAKSGAAIESLFIKSDVITIFLSEHKNVEDFFYPEIYEIADAVLYDPAELKSTIFRMDVPKVKDLSVYFDDTKDENVLWREMDKIIKRHIKK